MKNNSFLLDYMKFNHKNLLKYFLYQFSISSILFIKSYITYYYLKFQNLKIKYIKKNIEYVYKL